MRWFCINFKFIHGHVDISHIYSTSFEYWICKKAMFSICKIYNIYIIFFHFIFKHPYFSAMSFDKIKVGLHFSFLWSFLRIKHVDLIKVRALLLNGTYLPVKFPMVCIFIEISNISISMNTYFQFHYQISNWLNIKRPRNY